MTRPQPGPDGDAPPPGRLLLATTNPHKLDEFRALLAQAPFTLIDPRPLGLDLDVAETGSTFAENAAIKALAWARASGMLALADDSGLEIDALGGEPGLYSARWAGADVPYDVRNRTLLARLEGMPPARRTARYRCAIAVADPERVRVVVEGVVEGRIADALRGTNGFGYDPIFEVPELGRTFGEMPAAAKHRISHRARAAAAVLPALAALARDPAHDPDRADLNG
jgi:XTP/dITP diphosphohydrolase